MEDAVTLYVRVFLYTFFFFPGYSFSRFLSAILAPMAPQDEKPLPT